VRANAERLPLVVGVGGNNTGAVLEDLRLLDLSGFDAVLSVCPYYNRPTQEGIYQHFKAIAETSPKPVILYNVPSRTGCNMLPGTTLHLAELPHWEVPPGAICCPGPPCTWRNFPMWWESRKLVAIWCRSTRSLPESQKI